VKLPSSAIARKVRISSVSIDQFSSEFWFAFPARQLPLALNVISKILCFVAVIMLFVWREEGAVPVRRVEYLV
jgi:hypothetical protein